MNWRSKQTALSGAAFLMATSAIGPGFITQTTRFTQELMASFGFVIVVSIVIDIAVQLNIWRILSGSGKRAQQLVNEMVPGLGYLLAALILLGGLAFNIGNLAGAGLGLSILFPAMDQLPAVLLSLAVAMVLFWVKEAGLWMDRFAQGLGLLMILLLLYIVFRSHPPLALTAKRLVQPGEVPVLTIITLVGGTVGGYISFAGAHRLLDAGIQGPSRQKQVGRSAIQALLLAGLMRCLLFLAVLGVLASGISLNADNPTASVFQAAAGELGYKIFGLIFWCASITSIIGSAYTSISFIQFFHPWLNKNYRLLITLFLVSSTLLLLLIDEKPVLLLVLAGALNGMILPLALAILLLASHKKGALGPIRHPLWLQLIGWMAVLVLTLLAGNLIYTGIPRLWK